MPLLKETRRLFFATALAPSIRKTLAAYQKDLEKTGADVKWVELENIHITLKFLGSVFCEKIGEIQKIIDKEFKTHRSFQATLTQLGCFPSVQAPRVVWAGLDEKNRNFGKIAKTLEDILAPLGFKKEKRKFQAHATLGRIRSPRNIIALIEKINTLNKNFTPINILIDNITVFESCLSPKGPVYNILHQVKLR